MTDKRMKMQEDVIARYPLATAGDLLDVIIELEAKLDAAVKERDEFARRAPLKILNALNDYGGIDDKDDDPHGFEMLLHVATKALSPSPDTDGGGA